MSNWWKETILIMIIAIGSLKIDHSNAITKDLDRETLATDKQGFLDLKLEFKAPFLLVRDWSTCQQLDKRYQEIYGFETQNFYINICQYDDRFIYYRQSKADRENLLMIPAEPVFGGQIFQATERRVTYFVGVDSNGYYSSVMKNDNELVVEPQLKTPSATIGKTIDNDNANSKTETARLNLNSYEENDNNWRICTQNKHDSHPRLNGWQEFIGEFPDLAIDYATDNGYNFAYNSDDFKEASIETTDGLMVTLSIAAVNQKIGRVCVNPLVGSYSGL